MFTNRKHHILLIRILVIGILLYAFGQFVVRNYELIVSKLGSVNFLYVLLGVGLSGLGLFWSAYLWGMILQTLGETITNSDARKIWVASLVLKYLPGKIWNSASRLYVAKKRYNIRIARTTMGIYLEIILNHSASFVIVGCAAIIYSDMFGFGNYPILFLLPGFVLISLYPPFIQKIFGMILKLLKREEITIEATYFQMVKLLIYYFLRWIVLGITLFGFARSIVPIPIGNFFYLLGAGAFSISAGVLTFIMPGGIGVREALLVLLLGKIMPRIDALIISIISRIGQIIAEIIIVGILVRFDISLAEISVKKVDETP